MIKNLVNNSLKYFIPSVWLINGLLCKVLNLVPRHQQIVSRILSEEHSRILTIAIGIGEILLAVWFISGIKRRLNTILQITLVVTMNIIEFILAPDLLLWGHLNSIFALIFVMIVYYNEFIKR